ncbi:MAG: UDP-N-acetylmuramoyl-tripeptide--D-alanyl-D-alanine ligase [Bacteroidetes bacterium]|nr:MAG: UDP-N-acetylmuramoyl-tripeptide--D-alanyl-D-alanine ligase [Bacteroidota bacterium]
MEHLFKLLEDCKGVCTDTRTMNPDCLFICLSGANFDGNQFAQKALNQGARYVIVDRAELADEKHIFAVSNTLEFLQALALFHRRKFSIPIIGITGSNGKTSTKELIHAVLSQKYHTLATQGNLNNHIGVPLTLLRLTPEHEMAIIEMGANRFKDIEELCAIAEPDYGIITNIGKAHLEGFLNFEGVLKTKRELYEAVSQRQGVLFYNEGDQILKDALPANVKTKSYGDPEGSWVQGKLIELNPFVRMSWIYEGKEYGPVQTHMIGAYNYLNFLAAICIGTYFKLSSEEIAKALAEYTPRNNRSELKQTSRNKLILDAYNANPSSMQSAIRSFAQMTPNNKQLILGDMMELGTDGPEEHRRIIALCQELNLSAYFIGKQFFTERSSGEKEGCFYESLEDFKQHVSSHEIRDAFILIKGSRSMGLEAVVEFL